MASFEQTNEDLTGKTIYRTMEVNEDKELCYKYTCFKVIREVVGSRNTWALASCHAPNEKPEWMTLLPKKKQVFQIDSSSLDFKDENKGLWFVVDSVCSTTPAAVHDEQKEETDVTEVQPKKEEEHKEETDETTEQPTTKSTRNEQLSSGMNQSLNSIKKATISHTNTSSDHTTPPSQLNKIKEGTKIMITFPAQTDDGIDCYKFYEATILARKTGSKQNGWWRISWNDGSGEKDFKLVSNKERFKYDELLPYDNKNKDLWGISKSCTVVRPSPVKEETKDTANAKRFDLEKELSNIIGLAAVKKQIRTFSKNIAMYKARVAAGIAVEPPAVAHMAFMGNPGVGKTTVARLMWSVLVDAGMLEQEAPFVEVQKTQLVAGFVGQTGEKTKEVVNKARGGVLFVDEAYQLISGGEEDYGKVALEEIMSTMNETDSPIMIFAGYAEQMKLFFGTNPGLLRRIPHQFIFDDMTVPELAELAVIQVNNSVYKLAKDITVESLKVFIREATTPEQRAQTNGGLIKLLFKGALGNLNSRLSITADRESLVTYEMEDIKCGLCTLPKPVSEWAYSSSDLNEYSSPSTKTRPPPQQAEQASQALPAGEETKQSSVTMQNSVLSPSPSLSPGFTSSGEKKTASGNKRRGFSETPAKPLKPEQRQRLQRWVDERLEHVEYTLTGRNKVEGRLKFVDLKKDYRTWWSHFSGQEKIDSNVTHVKMNQIRDFLHSSPVRKMLIKNKTGYCYGVQFK